MPMSAENKRYIPLGIKLFIIIGALFVAFAVCFVFFQFQREKRYKSETLNDILQVYNSDLNDLIADNDSIGLSLVRSRLKEKGIRITVMDLEGNVLSDSFSDSSRKTKNNLSDREEVREALKHGTGHTVRRDSPTLGGSWFYAAAAFPNTCHVIRTSHKYDVGLAKMLESDNGYLWMALILCILLISIYFIYIRKIALNIWHLRVFAEMAEKNSDISNAAIGFSHDELGEISKHIVRLYAKLQNSEDDKTRLKRQLTQNIAHELKTPVSSIRGYLETITENPGIDETTRKDFMERCLAQSARLSNLISDITLLSKIDEASNSFSAEDINIYDLVEGIHRDTELQLKQKNMTMLVLISPTVIVYGNQQLIYSIFRNLTDNAIAYAGEGTTITVQCSKEDEKLYYFNFSDNGVGVPPENLPRLFERFYRVDKGRSRRLGGTGLGLAIVKNAVILHGGTIEAKISQTGGLEFDFTLARSNF